MYINGQYINYDRYLDECQRRYDPQWYDADEIIEDEDDLGIWDQVDMEVDERILNRSK